MADGINLGKQVGPLPLGAWLAVVGGGLALGWYATRSGGGDTATAEPEDQLLAESGVGTGGGQFVYEPPTTIPTPIETLDQWVNRAIVYLIGTGTPPLAADRAIKKYATSQTLTADEEALVNRAISGIGPPPAGELPAPSSTTSPPSPAPAKTITVNAPSTFRRGTSVLVNGKVSGITAPVVVTLRRKSFGSNTYRFYKLVPTLSTGKFSVRVASANRHSFSVKFSTPGASDIVRSFTVRS